MKSLNNQQFRDSFRPTQTNEPYEYIQGFNNLVQFYKETKYSAENEKLITFNQQLQPLTTLKIPDYFYKQFIEQQKYNNKINDIQQKESDFNDKIRLNGSQSQRNLNKDKQKKTVQQSFQIRKVQTLMTDASKNRHVKSMSNKKDVEKVTKHLGIQYKLNIFDPRNYSQNKILSRIDFNKSITELLNPKNKNKETEKLPPLKPLKQQMNSILNQKNRLISKKNISSGNIFDQDEYFGSRYNKDGNYFDLSEKTSNNILNFKEKVNLITQNIQ